jgi:hypothetical protein
MNHYVTLALTNRKSSVHLHALYSPRTALRMFTPRRDHLMVCLLYMELNAVRETHDLVPATLPAHAQCVARALFLKWELRCGTPSNPAHGGAPS